MTQSRKITESGRSNLHFGRVLIVAILFGALAPLTALAAEPSEEAVQDCFHEVRKVMLERQIEQLDSETAPRVRHLCANGDIQGARDLVISSDSRQRPPPCMWQVNTLIKRSGQSPSQEVLDEVSALCKQGELEAALEVIGESLAATKTPPKAPAEILSFTVDRNVVNKGDSVTLSWKTSNASSVHLNDLSERGTLSHIDSETKVQPSGSKKIIVKRDSRFGLTAVGHGSGPDVLVDKSVKVRIDHQPTIKFTDNHFVRDITIRAGEKVTLLWDVYFAETIKLDGKPVIPRGELIVSPSRTTWYTMTAWSISEKKKAEEKLVVRVSPFPQPSLSPPFSRIQVCRKIDNSGRCIQPDGPFWKGDKIHAVITLRKPSAGSHSVTRNFFESTDVNSIKGWKKRDSEHSRFTAPGGDQIIHFEISKPWGRGYRKLELVFDEKKHTRSSIIYCVECPGHDEW